MGLKKAIKKKETPKNDIDFLEKVEKQKNKREENEKLKLLEKLESQVFKIKKTPKISFLNSTVNSEVNSQVPHKRLIDNIPKNDKIIIKQVAFEDKVIKFDKKLLDDSEFRKVNIIKKKININCDQDIINNDNENEKNSIRINNNTENNIIISNKSDGSRIYKTEIKNVTIEKDNIKNSNLIQEEDEIIENEFIKGLSKEKLKFFMFKSHQIYNFLKSIKLVRYIEIFIEDGFEDLESILGTIDINFFFFESFRKFIVLNRSLNFNIFFV